MKGVINTADNYYCDKNVERIVYEYGNMLFRICFVMLGSSFDAEDAVQETFIKYMKKAPEFESSEHEKAWLIRVATNKCRDILRFRLRHDELDPYATAEYELDDSESFIIHAMYELPEKLKCVMYLHYVEGYSVGEIAAIIKKTPSAVKMRLKKGREVLKTRYTAETSRMKETDRLKYKRLSAKGKV